MKRIQVTLVTNCLLWLFSSLILGEASKSLAVDGICSICMKVIADWLPQFSFVPYYSQITQAMKTWQRLADYSMAKMAEPIYFL